MNEISLMDALIYLELAKMELAVMDMGAEYPKHYAFPDYEFTQALERVKRLQAGAFDLYERA